METYVGRSLFFPFLFFLFFFTLLVAVLVATKYKSYVEGACIF